MKQHEKLGLSPNGLAAVKTARRVLRALVAKKQVKAHKVPFKFDMDTVEVFDFDKGGEHCRTSGCIKGIINHFHYTDLSTNDNKKLYFMFYPNLTRKNGNRTKSFKNITEADALEAVERYLKTGIIQFKKYLPENVV